MQFFCIFAKFSDVYGRKLFQQKLKGIEILDCAEHVMTSTCHIEMIQYLVQQHEDSAQWEM